MPLQKIDATGFEPATSASRTVRIVIYPIFSCVIMCYLSSFCIGCTKNKRNIYDFFRDRFVIFKYSWRIRDRNRDEIYMQLHNSRVINTFISHKQSYTLYFYSAALSNTHISNLRQRFIYPIPRIFLFNLSCHHTRSLTEREHIF